MIKKFTISWLCWWNDDDADTQVHILPRENPQSHEQAVNMAAAAKVIVMVNMIILMVTMMKTMMYLWDILVWARFSLHFLQCGATWRGGPHVTSPCNNKLEHMGSNDGVNYHWHTKYQSSNMRRFSNVTYIFTSVEIGQRLVESWQITNQFRVFGAGSAVGGF